MIRLNYLLLIFTILLTFNAFAQHPISVINTACESKINPVGIGAEHPRLSWVINSNGRETQHIGVKPDQEHMITGWSMLVNNWLLVNHECQLADLNTGDTD